MPDWLQTAKGPDPTTYALSAWLFLRLLGLIYVAAFLSLAGQIHGLAGRHGILPAADLLASCERLGRRRFYRVPTLCWFSASDGFLSVLCWSGVVLALLLAFDVAPLPALICLWVLYLSLFRVCSLFLSYQWDVLLLETGFLAIFLAPPELAPQFPPMRAPPLIIVWALWWLLFRLMFSSAVVKLRSGDPAWRKLTALRNHYETQPLPTRLAWHIHKFPLGFHKASAVFMFAIELVVPFFIAGPDAARHVAAAGFVLLMILIEATGNYCFFNLLGIALSVLLIEDRALAGLLGRLFPFLPAYWAAPSAPLRWICLAVVLLVFILSVEPALRLFRVGFTWPKPLARFIAALAPFHLVSSYRLFALMTSERPEIIVEGSNDGVEWLAYEFNCKPGEPKRAPRFVAPHQPRLDWQMWFAALGYFEANPWFFRFLMRLLEGSAPVLGLLKENPFPAGPPRFVRGVVYDYRFTTRAERWMAGAWWKRERRGLYSPIVERGERGM
ncbi:MAG TPA: lipase maturation factor family protein [Verrucomicrobiae bacterium]|nr:lipase maturation factor family protein [Verrucomicrobiae bacterium]